MRCSQNHSGCLLSAFALERCATGRLQRLIQEQYIQIVAVSNPLKLGFEAVGTIRIHIDIKQMDKIIRELKGIRALWHIVQSTGGTGIERLGIHQKLQAKAKKQDRRDPRHQVLRQQLPQAVANPKREQSDGRQGRERTNEHQAGAVTHRQDQSHKEGFVAQFRQSDGREAGAKSRKARIGGERGCHA